MEKSSDKTSCILLTTKSLFLTVHLCTKFISELDSQPLSVKTLESSENFPNSETGIQRSALSWSGLKTTSGKAKFPCWLPDHSSSTSTWCTIQLRPSNKAWTDLLNSDCSQKSRTEELSLLITMKITTTPMQSTWSWTMNGKPSEFNTPCGTLMMSTSESLDPDQSSTSRELVHSPCTELQMQELGCKINMDPQWDHSKPMWLWSKNLKLRSTRNSLGPTTTTSKED